MEQTLNTDGIFQSRNFNIFIVIITFAKIVLMGFFSSDYQNMMFMPFVETFIRGLGTGQYNPYDYYYLNNLLPSFPYPPLMLLIETPGGFLAQMIPDSTIFFKNIAFKIPLLLFDLLGLYYLVRLFPTFRKYIAILYYTSPIILYAVYLHGQLDIIPTSLLMGCIYYLVGNKKNRYAKAGLALAFALLTKMHVLALIPFQFLYIYKQDGLKSACKFCLIVCGITAIGVLPFWGSGFINRVILNVEKGVLVVSYLDFVSVRILFPVLAVLIVYLIAFSANTMNKSLLISYCGILFAVLLSLCPPMPGWYVWIVPFITIFNITINHSRYKALALFSSLNFLYLIYFIFFHNTGYVDLYFIQQEFSALKVDFPLMRDVLFTLLSGVLIYITASMYRISIASHSSYIRRDRPFSIGVTGDSGSGKSVFARLLSECLGDKNILFIEGDGDHRWERHEKQWEEFTHLDPKANFLYRQAMNMQKLKSGGVAHLFDYNHESGKFSGSYRVKRKKFIVLSGLHALYLPQMRKNLDLKVFIDTEESLRRYWKICRDMENRGYPKEKVLQQINDRAEDAQKYILPQKKYADLIIQYFDKNLTDYYHQENHAVKISLRLWLAIAVDVEPIIEAFEHYKLNVIHDFSQDMETQMLEFDAYELKHAVIPFDRIVEQVISDLEEITKQELRDSNNINGIIKLFVILLIHCRMQGEF